MPGPFTLRDVTTTDARAMSELVVDLADHFLADAGRPDQASVFFELMTPAATAARIVDQRYRFLCATRGDRMAGFIGILDDTHLYQLFVQRQWHGQGLGRRLWEAVTEGGRPTVDFTVNASHSAVPFYRRLGFVPAGDPVEQDGVAWLPMRREKEIQRNDMP